MTSSRRHFLAQSATALAAVVPAAHFPSISRAVRQNAELRAHETVAVPLDDPLQKSLAMRALDAAKSAGAEYADVRLRRTTTEAWNPERTSGMPLTRLDFGLGIRVLYHGCWGYCYRTGATITADVAAQLGREATAQAKLLAKGPVRPIDLSPVPVVANGKWEPPTSIDPFTVSWDEKIDTFEGFERYYSAQPFGSQLAGAAADFTKFEQGFAATTGTWYMQTTYRTVVPHLQIMLSKHWRSGKRGTRSGEGLLSASGGGWEYVTRAPVETAATQLIAEANDKRFVVPVEVGRYDIVFDSVAMAKLLSMHLGATTKLDRAMGYRANDEGTSYLSDPLAMLGTSLIGTPLLNVTANRSMPGGLASVQWDDEGVAPDEAVLVKDGMLTDFQTTRESAGWLAPYYQKKGMPVRSHGGAMGGLENVPRQGLHNLVMAPSAQDTSFEALCSGVKRGLAVLGGTGYPDSQGLTSKFEGDVVYEIVNGKLGHALVGASLGFKATQLWKAVSAIGGAQTASTVGVGLGLGSGDREQLQTVSAPAAVVTQMAVTSDPRRMLFL